VDLYITLVIGTPSDSEEESPTSKRQPRPDGIDHAILKYLRTTPEGATIPDIHEAVCPAAREDFIRYRVSTLSEMHVLSLEKHNHRLIAAALEAVDV